MTDQRTCALCGHTEPRDLGTSLAHWRDALPGMAYEHVIRCTDRAKCRTRVERQGDVWPLVTEASDRGAA